MMKTFSISILCESLNQLAYARQLAKQLELPLHTSLENINTTYFLIISEDFIAIKEKNKALSKPIYIDFTNRQSIFRTRIENLRQELISRAVHIKKIHPLTIIDATAGFGKDSFILAKLGHHVHLIERNPIINILLNDGIKRLQKIDTSLNLTLISENAITYLNQLTYSPDVIYLDPMFPTRTKSALVKKEMRIIQEIVGNDDDTSELINVALKVVKYKVVVKRPRLGPYLDNIKPNFSLTGKVSRFDIYINQ